MEITPEPLTARTGDGLSLAIDRYRTGRARRGAVILQHGLASNRAVFVAPGQSLAAHLAALGYDVYVSELRGAGRSDLPSGGWSIDEYLELDIPALLATVGEHSGQARTCWIGHSMGGILMWMYALEHGGAPVERMISVGSALDYRAGKSAHRNLRHLLPLARIIRSVPFGTLSQIGTGVAGVGPATPLESINFQRSNMDRRMMRWIMRYGFGPIPVPLLDALSNTFSDTGMRRTPSTGGESIRYLERAAELQVPTMMLAGQGDAQCPPEAVAATAAQLGEAVVEQHTFGRAAGHSDDYGHFDLLVGKEAEREVWPHITRFLEVELPAPRGRSA
ncbi:MAG: alpha/beta fold hydrolase [Myxococcales bacterium]|nr:alpha/beta fold hydrolase [Myxococcales bacterium]